MFITQALGTMYQNGSFQPSSSLLRPPPSSLPSPPKSSLTLPPSVPSLPPPPSSPSQPGRVALRNITIRDMKRRQLFERAEVIRRAYLFVARNETLPDTIRTRAQQALHRLPKKCTPTEVKNTCIKTGKARGEFGRPWGFWEGGMGGREEEGGEESWEEVLCE